MLPKIKKVFILLLVSLLAIGCVKQKEDGLKASGTVEAGETVISAEISGKLTSMEISEGDFVKKGQVIAKIEDAILKLQVKQAQAAAAAAEAKLGETRKGNKVEQIRQSEEQAAQTEALVEGAKASFLAAQGEYQRTKDLFDQGASTKQQLDLAKVALDEAESRLKALSAQYRASLEQVKLVKSGATAEAVSAAQAVFNQAVAGWELAKAQLQKSVIKAPGDGVVTGKTVETGETVNPGSTVAVITDLNNLWVEIFIGEADLGKVSLGQQVPVFVDAYPNIAFKGKVTYIAQEAEFTPKNIETKEERTNMVFLVKVAVGNKEGKLKPGMPADVEFK